MELLFEQTHPPVHGMGEIDEPALVFTLIFCFIICLVFVVMFSDRLFIETSPRFPLEVPALSMVVAKLPFQVEFDQLDRASSSDGVQMKVKTDEPIQVLSFWGASCELLIHALNNDATTILTEELDLEPMDSSCQEVHPGEEQTLHLIPEASQELNFGPLPRLKYPLVVITRCLDVKEASEENHIVGGVWVIHVPDRIFNQPGHIVSQLVITNHGLVHNLQKMYMAADHTITDEAPEGDSQNNRSVTDNRPEDGSQGHQPPTGTDPDPSTTHEGFSSLVDGEHDCTVCQNSPITRVILPCRHACICEGCFKLVTKCPMCRGTIISHFSLYPGMQYGTVDDGSDSWINYI